MANDLCCVLSTYRKCVYCDKKVCEECFKETQSIWTDSDNKWVTLPGSCGMRCNSLSCAYREEHTPPNYYA